MGFDRGQDSTLAAYNVIYNSLAAIKSRSRTISTSTHLLNAIKVDAAHLDTLKFIDTAAHLLMGMLSHIKRSMNLDVAAQKIQSIALSLELWLSRNEKKDLQILKHAGASKYDPLFSHNDRFDDILGSAKESKWLLDDLNTAYEALEPFLSEDNIDGDGAKLARHSVPYDDLFHYCADRLFHAIYLYNDNLEVRLQLGAFRPIYPANGYRSLDILLQRKDGAEQFWLAFKIHFHASNMLESHNSPECGIFSGSEANPIVIVTDNDDHEPYWKTENPSDTECVFSYAEGIGSRIRKFIHNLELDKNDAWKVHLPKSIPANASVEYALPDLLRLSRLSWTDVDKIALAIQLSEALSYHYDGIWLSGRWKQANISLFRWGSQVPCRPWLRVSSKETPQVAPKSIFHRYPQVLELGTILLELQIGQHLESFLGESPAQNLDEQWCYAQNVYSGQLKGGFGILSRHYRHAVEFCLKPGTTLLQGDSIRRSIYENVVLPLKQAIEESGLDETTLESLDLRPPESTAVGPPKPPTVGENIDNSAPIPHPEEEFANGELDDSFDLFGDEVEHKADEQKSKEWLGLFKKIIKDRIGMGMSDRRVKVALLDTGIDLKHSYFEEQYPNGQIKSIRSWVGDNSGAEDKDGGDTSGHGTFIASILLSYGPEIDLYVARVAESRKFKMGVSTNVANALYHAQHEWKVDIITMSFGYPRGHREIWDRISLATQNGILVFAAASNDGRNQPRMFPARHPSVFAIHSMSWNGKKSDFNPPPEKDENFSILGEYIESAWLTCPSGGSGITRCLSGTSFATPIAVCLSSFLLTYIPILIPEDKDLFHNIQSYVGMRNVLQAIAAVDEAEAGSRYQYLGVEIFFRQNNTTLIREIIKKALSSYS